MGSIKLMSTARQQEIVEAVKTAVDLHNEGLSPSKALAKVATELLLNENEAKLMVDAFNTSKTLAHMRSSEGQEKAASFDLADYDEVCGLAFPKDQPKVAQVVQYDCPAVPNFHRQPKAAQTQKVAYTVVEHQDGQPAQATGISHSLDGLTDLQSRKAYEAIDYWRKKADCARQDLETRKYQMTDAVSQIFQHFKQANHIGQWSTFLHEAQQLHGQPAVDMLKTAADELGMTSILSRHGQKVASLTLADPDTTQHKLLKIALLSADLAVRAATEQHQALTKHAQELEAWRGLGKSEQVKQADVLSLATLGVMNKQMGQERQPLKPKEVDLSPDVGLESEYGKARLQLALRDMLDQDEVLSQHAGEDPARVFKAVQQLAELQPNILSQPMILQAALRRHLELGQTEPHELGQLKQLAAPTPQNMAGVMNPGGF